MALLRGRSAAFWGAGLCILLFVLSLSVLPGRAKEAEILDNDDRVAYLRELGWEVEEKPVSAQYTVLPEEFPDVLLEYNALQQQQGFDLLPRAGKQVTIYTYRVSGEGETVYCTLYVHSGQVIGGDVHSASLNGFMAPLRRDSKNG